jgi:hypothetical protein
VTTKIGAITQVRASAGLTIFVRTPIDRRPLLIGRRIAGIAESGLRSATPIVARRGR